MVEGAEGGRHTDRQTDREMEERADYEKNQQS